VRKKEKKFVRGLKVYMKEGDYRKIATFNSHQSHASTLA
jgi:hypothetical protein